MEFSQPSQATQATQQATQPLSQPPTATLGSLSVEEKTDIVCILHAVSEEAKYVVKSNIGHGAAHIMPNDDLVGPTSAAIRRNARHSLDNRNLALRLSSNLVTPRRGWVFGRFKSRCDLILTERVTDRCISSCHFRIYVNDHASLMIEDLSTNGTSVDDVFLRHGTRTQVLKAGSVIRVFGDTLREMKFMVTIPNRTSHEHIYAAKLRTWLTNNGMEPKYDSVRETNLGNHWDGGNTFNFTGKYGSGAFATVYRIQTKDSGEVFAAKELDTRRFALNARITQKLDSELSILKTLDHPNIVKYHQDIQHENYLYIIMEAIQFGTLAEMADDRHRIPEPQVRIIGKHLLRALDYLHAGGIAHRDIKPENVMVSSSKPLIVKLADFGLSKLVKDATAAMVTFCGTMLYCAPEIFPDYGRYVNTANKRQRNSSGKSAPYSSAVDMWSLGAVLFHVLAGVPPYVARADPSGVQMIEKVMSTDIDFDHIRAADGSEEAIDFLAGLLSKLPEQRPTKAECFAHPWLVDVEEVIDYSIVKPLPSPNMLEAVLEEDEIENEDNALTDELIAGMQQLTQPTADEERTPKKPRTEFANISPPRQVLYPVINLPDTRAGKPTAPPQLFGEITEQLRKSSGLFGDDFGAGPTSIPDSEEEGPCEMRLEISAGGSATMTRRPTRSRKGKERAISELPPLSEVETTEHVDGMQVDIDKDDQAKHVKEASDNVDSETSSEQAGSVDTITQSRLADVRLLSDDKAFDAQQKARQAGREQKARTKAQTFHGQLDTRVSKSSVAKENSDYKSFDDLIQPQGIEASGPGPSTQENERLLALRQFKPPPTRSPPQTFGQLIPLEGSFSQEPIPLKARSTLWGRGDGCDIVYADTQDLRVPKNAMKVVFYAPGIEEVEAKGGDWLAVPDIYTVIATSSSRGIRVNNQKLRAASENGKAALYGRLYTGDTVTVFHAEANGKFLKYKVEINFGGSAQERPESERPFVIEEEYEHMARYQARMLGASGRTEVLDS